jgi:hypothetical protein
MFARLCCAVSRTLLQATEESLPANAKGIPNPVALMTRDQQFGMPLSLKWQLTHEAPVSDCEESSTRVEGKIRPWAFGIMKRAGSLGLGR